MEKDLLWEELQLANLIDSMKPSKPLEETFENNEIIKQSAFRKHKEMVKKPQYAVLMDRYKSKPHKPVLMQPTKLDRLADPILGRFSRIEKYTDRGDSISPVRERQKEATKGFFLTEADANSVGSEENKRKSRFASAFRENIRNGAKMKVPPKDKSKSSRNKATGAAKPGGRKPWQENTNVKYNRHQKKKEDGNASPRKPRTNNTEFLHDPLTNKSRKIVSSGYGRNGPVQVKKLSSKQQQMMPSQLSARQDRILKKLLTVPGNTDAPEPSSFQKKVLRSKCTIDILDPIQEKRAGGGAGGNAEERMEKKSIGVRSAPPAGSSNYPNRSRMYANHRDNHREEKGSVKKGSAPSRESSMSPMKARRIHSDQPVLSKPQPVIATRAVLSPRYEKSPEGSPSKRRKGKGSAEMPMSSNHISDITYNFINNINMKDSIELISEEAALDGSRKKSSKAIERQLRITGDSSDEEDEKSQRSSKQKQLEAAEDDAMFDTLKRRLQESSMKALEDIRGITATKILQIDSSMAQIDKEVGRQQQQRHVLGKQSPTSKDLSSPVKKSAESRRYEVPRSHSSAAESKMKENGHSPLSVRPLSPNKKDSAGTICVPSTSRSLQLSLGSQFKFDDSVLQELSVKDAPASGVSSVVVERKETIQESIERLRKYDQSVGMAGIGVSNSSKVTGRNKFDAPVHSGAGVTQQAVKLGNHLMNAEQFMSQYKTLMNES